MASDRGRAWLTNGPQQRIERAPLTEAERRFAETLHRMRNRHTALVAEERDYRIEEEAADHNETLMAVAMKYLPDLQYASAAKTPAYAQSVAMALPATVTAVAPLLWLAAWGRRRRVLRRGRRLGLCLWCGYDLRGSASGGRCSECGAVRSPAAGPDAQHGRAAGV